MDQLDEISRYVGGETPQLDKMGGADWKHRKSRARRAVHEIASGLIKLYAARQATKGHAFGPDTPWQRELEDSFSFTETPDQLSCINDVKHDMEQIIPMDRLVCGDVGYGKTEIAVRAAFKAVQDGKQVAILVPTTLLVQQHAQTFATATRLSDHRGLPEPLPVGLRNPQDHRRAGVGSCRRGDRHPSPDQRLGEVQGFGSGDHRRGAALRCRAQGGPSSRCGSTSMCCR
jgi:hypothetical protein